MSVFDFTSPQGMGDARRAARRVKPGGNPFGTFNAAGQATSSNPYANVDPYQQFLGQGQPQAPVQTPQIHKGRTRTGVPQIPQGPQQGGPMGQQQALTAALGYDTANMQGAADQQHANLERQSSALEDMLAGLSDRFQGPNDQFGQQIDQYIGKAEQLGTLNYNDTRNRVGGMMDDVQGAVGRGDPSQDIANANEYAGNAVAGFDAAISEYNDRGAQDASAMASAIRRNGHSQMQMARAGVHPDGTPMTAAEQSAAVAEVQWNTETAVQEQITPLLTRYNDTLLQMRRGLADLRSMQANTALQGGQLRSQYGLESGKVLGDAHMGGIQAMNQATEMQAKMMEMGATLARAKADLSGAAQLNAVNLEMQGRSEVANMIRQNPQSVVSWFQGLMALYAAKAAGQTPQNPQTRGGRGKKGSPNMDALMQKWANDGDGRDGEGASDNDVPRGTKGLGGYKRSQDKARTTKNRQGGGAYGPGTFDGPPASAARR